jgi:hypothetical protein
VYRDHQWVTAFLSASCACSELCGHGHLHLVVSLCLLGSFFCVLSVFFSAWFEKLCGYLFPLLGDLRA